MTPKWMIFLETFQGGRMSGIFNLKHYVADFGPFNGAFWAWNSKKNATSLLWKMKLRRDPVRVWERFRWILKKKVKEEIVFILYSVQHMSYLYHKHHIFNIFVYNSMSTFSMRCWALDISVPLLCLFSFSSSSSFHFKTNPIMFPFSHHFSPIWIGWEDFFIAQLPQNWFQKTLWLFSTTFLSPTAPFSKSLSSSRFHFHL